MKVSDAIADYLVAEGVTHCFGIIGGGNVTLWDALTKRLEMICCHHEQAAAQAATYYYRVCERIAPVVVTSGAGSANAITGVMAANMDSIPLIVLAGNENSVCMTGTTRILGVQGYESAALAKGYTKFAATCWSAGETMQLVPRAFKEALGYRQGAVWLNIPKDIQNAMAR